MLFSLSLSLLRREEWWWGMNEEPLIMENVWFLAY
jgi:hypothetical protein